MVGREYDLVGNPLGAVQSTFEKAMQAEAEPSLLVDGKDWGATQLFRQFIDQPSALSQIPILDRTSLPHLKPNTLVRYRGMIQDMLGNEFYVGVHKDGGGTWTTNKFNDVCHLPPSEDTRIWERRLLYCVPVPGQNIWAESYSESVTSTCSNVTSPHREKRPREDCVDMDIQASDQDFQGSTSAKKMRENMHSISSHKEYIPEGPTSNSDMVPNFDKKSLPCLLKIYDTPESELKLNDVFEFIGLLTFDPKLASEDDTGDELLNGLCEDTLVHLPSNKVPRLHCIVHRKLAIHDFLSGSLTLEPKCSLVKGVRESLLGHLTSVLGNDGLAAHFMLLHLLSGVHTRVGLVAVGKLSLNLTCFSKEILTGFGNRIKVAVANLIPFTMCMSLTIDHLNSASLAPTKDYDTNRLVSGPLQLTEGTHLTVDETQLQTGTLNSVGVENVRLLKTLLESQKVDYDFKYYKMEMAADAQVLILSEAKSNILPADVILSFHPQSHGVSEYEDMEALKAWRCYLATFRSLQHSIDSEMQKIVEDDLVAARQSDRSLGSSDFSRLLTMARLVSMSYGETCLSLEHWQMVKELERLRRERSGQLK